MAFCKLLTVLVIIHNTGGLLGAEVGSYIVGGQEAIKGRWPWMVHINMTADGIKWRGCGGTIVSNAWVLTAANCWYKSPQPSYLRSMVVVGAHSLRKEAVRYMGIESITPHPYYRESSSGHVNDIALIKLKKKLTFSELVRPVTLPTVDDTFDSSSDCWITGWGQIGKSVPLPDPESLQQLKIPIIPQSICKKKYAKLTSDMLCAGDMDGGNGACKGDNGNPLVCRKGSGFVQVGITSSAGPDDCAVAGYPGIYTQVSKYLRFINEKVHRAEEASAEV